MLSNILLAKLIEDRLNELTETDDRPYVFRIFTEIADLKKGSHNRDVRGLLRATSAGDVVPLSGFSNSVVPFEINFIVSSFAFDNTHVIRVSEIIKKFIRDINGKKVPLDNGFAIIIPGEPTFYNVETRPASGDSTLCSLTFEVNYFESAISSADRKWFLDGVELPYFSERVSDVRQGVTNNISGRNATQSLTLQQVKTWMFELPYDSSNAACVQLQKDILEGDPDKTYELKFYDGVTYTEAEPFIKTVTLFNGSDTETIRSRITSFVVAFAETDKAEETGVRYYMALIDNKFTPDTPNTRCFESQEEQQAYYNSKIAEGAAFVPILAPNLQGLTITQQVYKDANNYDLMWLLQKNYAIIKIVDHDKDDKTQYLYFWAKGYVGAKNTTLWDLRLDSIQTYLFDPNLEIAPCVINKAHLNRWLTDGNYVSFRSNADSPLFKRENYQDLAVRMIKRTPIYLCVDKSSTYVDGAFQLSPLDQFIKDNVKYWGYVYCSLPGDDAFPNSNLLKLQINGVEPGYVCFSYPIYKDQDPSSRKIKFETSYLDKEEVEHLVHSDWSYNTFWESVLLNDMEIIKNEHSTNYPTSAHILSVKISNRPPMEYKQYYPNVDYFIDQDGNLVLDNINAIDQKEYVVIGGEETEAEVPSVTKFGGYIVPSIKILPGAIGGPGTFLYNYAQRVCNTYDYLSEPYTLSKRNFFNKNEIIGANRSIDFNPKLLSTDFYKVSLESADGQRFDYDAQKLGLRTFRLKYSEALTPDVTRGYLRIENNLNPGSHDSVTAYGKYFDQDFTGLVFSSDNLMPYSATQYAAFIAQNKNFFMQAQMQKKYETTTAIVRTGLDVFQGAQSVGQGAARAAGGDVVGGASQVQGGVNSILSSGVNFGLSLYGINHNYKMKMLSVDNVRAAPEMIKNASGNPFFVDSVTGQQLYICEYSALDIDLREADDDMYINGFNYNRIGSVKNFIRTRKYFNAVAAEIETISGVPMSNEVRADIKNRFALGLRFWHSDDIQYALENYETYLE